MEELILVKPSNELKAQILDYKKEYLEYGEDNINGSCGLMNCEDFEAWLETCRSIEVERLRHNVHASTYFTMRVRDHKLIGSIQLRHTLTDELRIHGGNIGYGIRPSERKKGYGKKQLKLVLEIGQERGMTEVLITCNKNNIPSRRTVLSCGGNCIGENSYEGEAQVLYMIHLNSRQHDGVSKIRRER